MPQRQGGTYRINEDGTIDTIEPPTRPHDAPAESPAAPVAAQPVDTNTKRRKSHGPAHQ